jgi:hypothetical protein
MEWSSRASARTEQLSERAARVGLTLDLNTFGALGPERLHDDLNTRREQIRQEIFRAISGQVVPAAAQHTGMPVENPDSWRVSGQHETHSSWRAPQLRHGRIATDHRMDIHFDFEADRAMNAATMLHLGREQVGMAVADNFVHSLDQHFFSKQESSGRWQADTDGNGAGEVAYEATEAPTAAEEMPQASQESPAEAANEPSFDRLPPKGEAGQLGGMPREAANEQPDDGLDEQRAIIRDDEEDVFNLEARLPEYRWNRGQAEREQRWLDVVRWQNAIREAEQELEKCKEYLEEDRALLVFLISLDERFKRTVT